MSLDLMSSLVFLMSSTGSVFLFVLFYCCRYYCVGGAVTPTPSDGITGGPCPEGFYCPQGTVQPVPCKPGTFSAVTHATQCEPCLPGWFCLSGSLYLCPAGLLFLNALKSTLTFVSHLYANSNGAKSLKEKFKLKPLSNKFAKFRETFTCRLLLPRGNRI